MQVISVRIFGSEACVRCQALKKAFDFYAIGYEYIDVNDPKNEKLCDDHNVHDLPQIEAFYPNLNNKVFYKKVGYYNPIQFLENSVKETQELYDPTNSKKLDDLINYKKLEIEKMSQQKPKSTCGKCSKNKNV